MTEGFYRPNRYERAEAREMARLAALMADVNRLRNLRLDGLALAGCYDPFGDLGRLLTSEPAACVACSRPSGGPCYCKGEA